MDAPAFHIHTYGLSVLCITLFVPIHPAVYISSLLPDERFVLRPYGHDFSKCRRVRENFCRLHLLQMASAERAGRQKNQRGMEGCTCLSPSQFKSCCGGGRKRSPVVGTITSHDKILLSANITRRHDIERSHSRFSTDNLAYLVGHGHEQCPTFHPKDGDAGKLLSSVGSHW